MPDKINDLYNILVEKQKTGVVGEIPELEKFREKLLNPETAKAEYEAKKERFPEIFYGNSFEEWYPTIKKKEQPKSGNSAAGSSTPKSESNSKNPWENTLKDFEQKNRPKYTGPGLTPATETLLKKGYDALAVDSNDIDRLIGQSGDIFSTDSNEVKIVPRYGAEKYTSEEMAGKVKRSEASLQYFQELDAKRDKQINQFTQKYEEIAKSKLSSVEAEVKGYSNSVQAIYKKQVEDFTKSLPQPKTEAEAIELNKKLQEFNKQAFAKANADIKKFTDRKSAEYRQFVTKNVNEAWDKEANAGARVYDEKDISRVKGIFESDKFQKLPYVDQKALVGSVWYREKLRLMKAGKTPKEIADAKDWFYLNALGTAISNPKNKTPLSPFAIRSWAENMATTIDAKIAEQEKLLPSKNLGLDQQQFAPEMKDLQNLLQAKQLITQINELPDEELGDYWEGMTSAEKIPFASAVNTLGKNLRLYEIANKDKRTKAEELLLLAKGMQSDIETAIEPSFGYKVGKQTGEMLPYIGEFILTGGAFTGTQAVVTEALTKKLGAWGASKVAQRAVVKPLGVLMGTLAQTTANPQMYLNNMIERMSPRFEASFSEKGDSIVAKLDFNTKGLDGYSTGHGEDAFTAALRGYGLAVSEVFTERLGEMIFEPAAAAAAKKLFGDPELAKRMTLAMWMKKRGLTPEEGIMEIITRKMAWNGIISELGEELVNMPLSNIISDRPIGEGMDKDNLSVLAATIVSVGAVTGGLGLAGKAMGSKTVPLAYTVNGQEKTIEVSKDMAKAIQFMAQKPDYFDIEQFKNSVFPNVEMKDSDRETLISIINSIQDKADLKPFTEKSGPIYNRIGTDEEPIQPEEGDDIIDITDYQTDSEKEESDGYARQLPARLTPEEELKNIEEALASGNLTEDEMKALQNRYKEVVDAIQNQQKEKDEAAAKQKAPVSGVPGQKTKTPTQKPQAKPTKPAEPQKPQEPLKPVEWTPQVNDRIVDMVSKFNSLTPAKKSGKKGLNLLNAIGRSAGAHNLELKEVKSGPGTKLEVYKDGKKLSRTPIPNEFEEPTQEQYEFAQRAIKYGIIPPGSDIGLTESEMEASTKALVSGKRTKEAMRLVHAIDKAKKFHGVEVADIDLRGRKTGRKTFVSFTEIEEITNENFTGPALTPEEEEVMAAAYDELFSGLDEDQKQEIENLFIQEEPTNEKPTTKPKAGTNEAGEGQEDAGSNRGSEESEDEEESVMVMREISAKRPDLKPMFDEGEYIYKKMMALRKKIGFEKGKGWFVGYNASPKIPFPYRLQSVLFAGGRSSDEAREKALADFKQNILAAKEYFKNPPSEQEIQAAKSKNDEEIQARKKESEQAILKASERMKALNEISNNEQDFINEINPNRSSSDKFVEALLYDGLDKQTIRKIKDTTDLFLSFGEPVSLNEMVKILEPLMYSAQNLAKSLSNKNVDLFVIDKKVKVIEGLNEIAKKYGEGKEESEAEIKVGDTILWEGSERKVIGKTLIGKEYKYNIELPNGKNVWTNYDAIQKEKSSQKPIFKGSTISKMAVSMGSDQGGISDFTADKIKEEDYEVQNVLIEGLLESDKDLAEYIENAEEVRDFEGEPFQMLPIVNSKGEVIDGYNRIHQAIENGDAFIQVYYGIPKAKSKSSAKKKNAAVNPKPEGFNIDNEVSFEDIVNNALDLIKTQGKPISSFKDGDRVVWANVDDRIRQYIEGTVKRVGNDFAIQRFPENPESKKYKTAIFNANTLVAPMDKDAPIYTGQESVVINPSKSPAKKKAAPKPQSSKSSELDGERLSEFKLGDIVYRNYNGRYEEYEILKTKTDIWILKDTNTGKESEWNSNNNGGFILKEKAAPKPETPKEYRYELRNRPFGIGTYPKEDTFLRFEQPEGSGFGYVVYSEKLPQEKWLSFELSPETEIEEATKGKVFENEYYNKIVATPRKGNSNFVDVVMSEPKAGTDFTDEITLSAKEFFQNIQDGYFTEVKTKPDLEAIKSGKKTLLGNDVPAKSKTIGNADTNSALDDIGDLFAEPIQEYGVSFISSLGISANDWNNAVKNAITDIKSDKEIGQVIKNIINYLDQNAQDSEIYLGDNYHRNYQKLTKFLEEYLIENNNNTDEFTQVFHGGVDFKLKGNNPIFVTEKKEEAQRYASDHYESEEGELHTFLIDKSKLTTEDVARSVISELGLEPLEIEEPFNEIGIFELLDNNFDKVLSDEQIDLFINEMKSRGYEGFEFDDNSMVNFNRSVTNIYLFDQKKSLKEFPNKKDVINKLVGLNSTNNLAESTPQYDLFGSQEPRKGKSDFRKEYEQRVKAAEAELKAKQKEIDAKKKELAARNADAAARTRILSPMLGQLNVMQQEYQKLLDQDKRVKDAENSQQTLFEGKQKYNPNQMVIDFNNPQQIEISHGSVEKMLENVEKAVLGVEGHYSYLDFVDKVKNIYGEQSISEAVFNYITKRSILDEFKKQKFVSLKGKKVHGPQDVADAVLIFRSPYVEHSMLIMVDAVTGNVVHNAVFTLNHPGATYFPETKPIIENAIMLEHNLGIKIKLYVSHNHPSGNHNPSDLDISLTRELAKDLDANGIDFGGHVIIDTTKFTFLTYDTNTGRIDNQVMDYKEKPEKLFTTRLNLKNAFTQETAMSIGKTLFENKGFVDSVMFLDSYTGISCLTIVPTGMNKKQLKEWLEANMRGSGARSYIVYNNGKSEYPPEYFDFQEASDYIYDSDGKIQSLSMQKGFPNGSRLLKYQGETIGFAEPNPTYLTQALSDNNIAAKDNLEKDGKEIIDGWYSRLREAIRTKGNTQTADQWQKWIEARANEGKLSREEVYWTGLEDYLQERGTDKLTTKDILNFLEANRIELAEKILGETGNETEKQKASVNSLKLWFSERQITAYWHEDEVVVLENEAGEDIDIDIVKRAYALRLEEDDLRTQLESAGLYNIATQRELKEFLDFYDQINFEWAKLDDPDEDYEEEGAINSTRLQYTSSNLTNKKEIVLYVDNPSTEIIQSVNGQEYRRKSVDPYNQRDEIHFGTITDGRALVWIRFGDVTSEDGRKVMVIDEIQSQRHEAGRDHGYTKTIAQRKQRIKNASVEFTKNGNYYNISQNGTFITQVSIDSWEENSISAIADIERSLNLYDAHKAVIPDAPFKKNYTDLAIKRALRFAAENGYDAMAWNTGEQVNKRFSLATIVQTIYHREQETKGLYDLMLEGDSSEGRTFRDIRRNLTYDEMRELIGKEPADMIKNNEGVITNKDKDLWVGKRIEIDVDLGSEPMKKYYGSVKEGRIGDVGKITEKIARTFDRSVNVTPISPSVANRTGYERDVFAEGMSIPITDAIRDGIESQGMFMMEPGENYKKSVQLSPENVSKLQGLINKLFSQGHTKFENIMAMLEEKYGIDKVTDSNNSQGVSMLDGMKAVYSSMLPFLDGEEYSDFKDVKNYKPADKVEEKPKEENKPEVKETPKPDTKQTSEAKYVGNIHPFVQDGVKAFFDGLAENSLDPISSAKRNLSFAMTRMAGNHNRFMRQGAIEMLTGKRPPVSQAGVTILESKILDYIYDNFSTELGAQPNSSSTPTQEPVLPTDIQPSEQRGQGRNVGTENGNFSIPGLQPGGDLFSPQPLPPTGGEPSVGGVRGGKRGVDANDNASSGSGESGLFGKSGVQPESEPRTGDEKFSSIDGTQRQYTDKLEAQKNAPTNVIVGDIKNIAATLPYLMDGQVEDVWKAETRLLKDGKKGILFGNQTGTGKTFLFLGLIKRTILNNPKADIIIVSPSGPIQQTINSAKILGLNIEKVEGVKDKGSQIAITTYQNFYQNKELIARTPDLVIFDESHNLLENKAGETTAYLKAARNLIATPDEAFNKAAEVIYGRQPEFIQDTDNIDYFRWKDVVDKNKEAVQIKAKELENKTKVMLMSATPFSHEFTLRYADGILFNINQGKNRDIGGAYNSGNNDDLFFITNFGYRMRYNKLTTPDAKVNLDLMYRNFADKLMKEGAMSVRLMDVPFDYSREFIDVLPGIGKKIDEGIDLLDSDRYRFPTTDAFSYQYLAPLLEAIKAEAIIDRVKQHIAMGRKVVIFHGYNNPVPQHPFGGRLEGFAKSEEQLNALKLFWAENPKFREMEVGLNNPINTLKNAFGDKLVLFNGTINDINRQKAMKDFNNDPNVNVILVNISAGGAGLSLHDDVGGKQRVLINLGLPIRPVQAIQVEGRIYRTGQKSNAIFEYAKTGLDFEMRIFGTKIAERVNATEALVMGSMGRNLKEVFKSGYLNSNSSEPSAEQGIGGKEGDKSVHSSSPYEFAKTLYWGQQKGRKNDIGVDYFATPEPIGLKMVEFLNLKPGEKVLEPSAGHGAIARFVPEDNILHVIEPSSNLMAKLSVVANPMRKEQIQFENYNVINKYDGIVMNPPFGHAGKTAMDHVAKAFEHLYDGGRIVAIIPNGQGEARFSKWYESEEAAEAVLVGKIEMPAMFAERAGTGAMTTIYIIDKVKNEEQRANSAPAFYTSFASAKDNDELFDRIEDFEVRPRPEVALSDEKMQDLKENMETTSFTDHIFKAKNGTDWFIARLTENLDYETMFKPLKTIAAKHGNGWYMSKGGKGFAFKTEEDRSAFKVEAQEFINNEAPEADIDGMISEAKIDLDEYIRNSRNEMYANPLLATLQFGAKVGKLMGLYIIKGVKSLPDFLRKVGLSPSKYLRDLWVKMGEVADKYWRQPKNLVTLKQPYSFIAMRNQPYFGAVLNRAFDGTRSMHEIFHNLRAEINNMEVLIVGNPTGTMTPMLESVVEATRDIYSFITYMGHAEAMEYVDDLRRDRLPAPILYDYNYNEKERLIYNLVYGFRPVETLIKNIRETGAIINENENPIIGTDLYPGRVADKARAFEEAVLQSVKGPTGKPVYKPSLIERMRADGINIGEVDAKTQTPHGKVMPGFYLGYTYGYETIPTFPEYLHALHAKERNDDVARRRQEKFNNKRIELENAIANGVNVDTNQQILNSLLTNLEPEFQLMPDGGSGMTNQEAQDILDEMLNNPEKLALYNQYAAEFTREVVLPIQKELVRTGQLSKDKMEELNELFGNWVHLPVDFYSKGLSSTGMASAQVRSPLKRVKGSLDRRVNPFLATIDYYARVLRAGEMNLARQQMYNLVRKFPNENLFKIIPPVSGVVYNSDSGDLTPEFNNAPPNSIPVYKNGMVHYIQFLGANGIHLFNAWESINKTHDRTIIHRFFRTINAALYFANIKFNPTFLLSNLIRDDLSAFLNTFTLSEVEKAKVKSKIAIKVPIYTPKAIRAAYMASRGQTNAANKSMIDYAIKLQNQGGITILGNMVGGANLEERIDKMAEMVQQMDEKTLLQQMAMPGSYFFNALGDLQSAVENGTRVAVFRAAIEAGLSEQQAAFIAKNITVNFDRKGANAGAINDMVWLFKTSASGIARFAKALNTKEGKIVAASLVGIGVMLSMWNRSKCEDAWNSIDEGIKSSKFIYVLDCEHLVHPSIPFAQGWSFFLYLGQLFESFYAGAMTKGDAVANTTRAAINAVNPLGSSSDFIGFTTNFLPTALDKGLEFASNKTWYNKPISPEQYGFEEKLKDSELYWDETSEWAKSMATWLSENSGSTNAKNEGAIEVSPSTLEYAYKTLAGGAGRDVAGFGTLVSDIQNNELGKNINKYPVVRALVTKVSSQNVVNAMYKLYEHGQLNPITPEDTGKFRALVFMRANQVMAISDPVEQQKEAQKLQRLAKNYEMLIVKDMLSNVFVDKNLKEISQILSALNR